MQCNTGQYSAVWCNAMQCNVMLCCAMLCCRVQQWYVVCRPLLGMQHTAPCLQQPRPTALNTDRQKATSRQRQRHRTFVPGDLKMCEFVPLISTWDKDMVHSVNSVAEVETSSSSKKSKPSFGVQPLPQVVKDPM